MSIEGSERSREGIAPDQLSVLKIFRESFRHSQGSPEFQQYPIEYLTKKGYLKGLPIPKTPPEYIHHLIKPPKNHDNSVQVNITTSINSMWEILYGYAHVYTEKDHAMRGKEGINNLIECITNITIFFDTNRQEKPRPRITDAPPMMMTEYYDSFLDPHASHIRRYAVLGQDAGHLGYNEMFREIHTYIKDTQSSLKKLIPAWSRRHPHVDFLTNEVID